MKLGFLFTIISISFPIYLFSQNPISPPGVYLADPSAHVFSDGKLYIFGSQDESCSYYCSWRYPVLSTTDLKKWKLENFIFSSKGAGDQVKYNDKLLFAPDCIQKDDSFYLYYCQPDLKNAEGVTVSANPNGPFENAQKMNIGKHQQIDPSVFIDDDGEAYYLWGQFALKMAKLKPDMREIDEETIQDSILTEEEHFFHEGAYLTKRNGIYYLVYADMSRADMPTCLGYATSTSPFGPYKYRGVIIDNNSCNPGNWNNHGSIAEYKNQWYVFYHRSTHGCKTIRKACVEPIYFNKDGSIDEVEMTSQGAGSSIKAKSKIEAEWACLLQGDILIEEFDKNEEMLSSIQYGDKAAFKYIDFGDGADSILMKVKIYRDGKIYFMTDKPWTKPFAVAELFASDVSDWQSLNFPVNSKPIGKHALWLVFVGEGKLFDIDWVRFK